MLMRPSKPEQKKWMYKPNVGGLETALHSTLLMLWWSSWDISASKNQKDILHRHHHDHPYTATTPRQKE
jgi:hypothetical protein